MSIVAVLVMIAALVLIVRRVDVRLVLTLAALPLFGLNGRWGTMLGLIARELSNPRTIVPIGSAVGFAFVLKRTGCDQHLVHLLIRPLKIARVLLIPGGVAAGYLVNSAVVSQTGAAAVLGPVLVPVLRAAGVSPVTAGSVLLLGCSMGGELYNPGAVEIVTLADTLPPSARLTTAEVVAQITPLNLIGCGVALLVFWRIAARRPRGADPAIIGEPGAEAGPFRINPLKAVVPLIPLVILFSRPGFVTLPGPLKDFQGPATVLAAMLIGIVAAALTSPTNTGKVAADFFEGAGYGYTHVISLIVTATLFTEAIKETGLIEGLAVGLSHRPVAALGSAVALPWILAAITGSGIGPAVAVIKILVPTAGMLGFDPVRLGGLCALTAHFGRTMSPAAAVVMMAATLSQADPLALIRRVIPPLLVAGAALVGAMLWLGR